MATVKPLHEINPPRNGEVALAKRVTEGALRLPRRPKLRAPSTPSLRLAVPLPVPGRI